MQAGTFSLLILMVLVWSDAPSLNLMNSVFFSSNLLFKLQENFRSKRTLAEPYSKHTCLFHELISSNEEFATESEKEKHAEK